MPNNNSLCDWEVYDENNEFIDILSMKKSEINLFLKKHEGYTVKNIGYTNEDGDDSWETDSKTNGNIYNLCIPVTPEHQRIKDVYAPAKLGRRVRFKRW